MLQPTYFVVQQLFEKVVETTHTHKHTSAHRVICLVHCILLNFDYLSHLSLNHMLMTEAECLVTAAPLRFLLESVSAVIRLDNWIHLKSLGIYNLDE